MCVYIYIYIYICTCVCECASRRLQGGLISCASNSRKATPWLQHRNDINEVGEVVEKEAKRLLRETSGEQRHRAKKEETWLQGWNKAVGEEETWTESKELVNTMCWSEIE